GARGESRLAALVEAKRLAADVERRRRELRAAAADSADFLAGVKRGELAGRLSASGEALQRACDALAVNFVD
ncbi:MAG: hypothetical protein KGM24_02745, partial [Elusimicrobia bacterium]|nr:hypothetical protein [Elusimicrobiota bacterium]